VIGSVTSDLDTFESVCCVMDAATGAHGLETLATTPFSPVHDRAAAGAYDGLVTFVISLTQR
jgi:hypothetical protein